MIYFLIITPLQEFLKKEFSEENIVFWIACENFRNITDFEEVLRITLWGPPLCVLGFWRLFLMLQHKYWA